MVWKLWLALGVAGIVTTMTLLTGIINQTRFAAILYRMAVSFFVLGSLTYLLGVLYEKYILPYLLARLDSRQEKDVSAPLESNPDEVAEMKRDEEKLQAEFSPFTADNLNRVSPPNS